MMKGGLVAAAILGAACSGGPQFRSRGGGDEVLSVTGRVEGAPLRIAGADLAALPRRSIRAHDPRGGTDARFEGLSLQAFFLDEVQLQRGADVLVVHGADGYEVAVPLGAVRQHRPVLADRIDGAPVASARPGAAPLVLAWPNLDQPGLDHDPRARWWWVDGVKQVEVLSWTASYGRALRVPQGAPDEARTGADAFSTSCIQCHRVRGAGGSRGPELTATLANATGRSRFADAVRAHAKREDAASVADLPQSTVRNVETFLSAVAVSDPTAPPDEPPPEPMPDARERSPMPPGYVPPPRARGVTMR